MNTRNQIHTLAAQILALLFMGALLVACGNSSSEHDHDDEHHEHEADSESHDFERGLHDGRLLKDDGFTLEITVYETGTAPHFRVYPYLNLEPVDPSEVELQISLKRLGSVTDANSFVAEGDYLRGQETVREPHSYDVEVIAIFQGRVMAWDFSSHEGRVHISKKQAEDAGIETDVVGPALINETIEVLGQIDFAPDARARLRARYPGKVLEVRKSVGDTVKAGEVLARIESNDSLRSYSITAPIAGVIVERNVHTGDISMDEVLFVVGDPSRLQADFHIFATDMDSVRPGQEVAVQSVTGATTESSEIDTFLPTKESATQTIIARTSLNNPSGTWIPGMTVKGTITINSDEVPVAVRTEAIQRFRDFHVVFARFDDTYEVRMLELGRQTEEWTEVLSGISPGQEYVTANSFIIKADVEKGGASHDH